MDEDARADFARIHRLAANQTPQELTLGIMDRFAALLAHHQIVIESIQKAKLRLVKKACGCPNCIDNSKHLDDQLIEFIMDRDAIAKAGDVLTSIDMDFSAPPPEVIQAFLENMPIIEEDQ